ASVYNNAGDSSRYSKQSKGDGKFFFVLRAGNNQEIAKSVDFDSEGATDKAINMCVSELPVLGAADKDAYTPHGKDDNYKRLAFYQERISSTEDGFQTFEDDGNFYFTFNSGGGILLISEGYKSAAARDNGIESVKKNIGTAERYQFQQYTNGKYYFDLRAGNNQEIATSIWFDQDEDMQAAVISVVGGQAPSTQGEVDDYLDCDAYKGHPRLSDNTDFSTFEKDGEFYFAMLDDKDAVALRSEGYTTSKARDNGIESVLKNIQIEKRFKLVEDEGKWFIALRAGNNQEIARSCPFDSKAAAEGYLSGASQEPVPVAAVPAAPKTKRKKRAKKPKVAKVEVGSGSYPCSDISYKIFKSGNGKHYFTYRDKNDKAVLISSNIRGYDALEDVEKVVGMIAANGSKSDHFEVRTTKNDKFYYYLKDDDGKNIGKSFFFDTKAEMQDAMKLFDCGLAGASVKAGIAAKAGVGSASATSEHRDDDYMVCSAYEGQKVDTDGFSRFEEGGEYFFAMVRDGDVKLRSERYTSGSGRDNGIASVKKNRNNPKRYSIEEARNIFYVILKAGNHQEIARSCPYKDRAAAEAFMADPMGMVAAKAAEEAKAAAEAKAAEEKAKAQKIAADKAAVSAGSASESRDDDYMVCSAYEGHEVDADGFSRFEEGGEYFFAMVRDGEIKLRSERYSSASGRDNGIASVKKNRDNPKRYAIEEARKIFYVILKAGNGQEIGRSCPYKERSAAQAFMVDPMGLVAAKAAKAKADERARKEAETAAFIKAKAAEEAEATKLTGASIVKQDDYLKCDDYKGHKRSGAYTNFSVFEHQEEHYFAMLDKEDNVLLRSEGYKTTKSRNNGIESVIRNMDNEKRWHAEEKLGYHFAILKAGNGQEIGRSCPYSGKTAVAGFISNPTALLATGALATGVVSGMGGAEDGDDDTTAAGAIATGDDMKEGGGEQVETEVGTGAVGGEKETGKEKGAGATGLATGAVAASAAAAGAGAKKVVGTGADALKSSDTSTTSDSGSKRGGIPWWIWPLLALALIFLLWKGCGLCNTPAGDKVTTEQVVPPVSPEVQAVPVDTIETADAEATAEDANDASETASGDTYDGSTGSTDLNTTDLANSPSHPIFSIPAGLAARKLNRLGTNPEFGNVHGLDAQGFYNKLKAAYDSNPGDRKFLDDMFRAMGYADGFSAAQPYLFSEVELPRGLSGNLGYGKNHGTGYYTLPDAQRDRLAFKIQGANGRDLHFMKTCGNHFYFEA
ncbi:MAG: YegP family protein, partial [Bacteroidia bacterium]|nr:YegP family protein [Bacteroidia bacterium]